MVLVGRADRRVLLHLRPHELADARGVPRRGDVADFLRQGQPRRPGADDRFQHPVRGNLLYVRVLRRNDNVFGYDHAHGDRFVRFVAEKPLQRQQIGGESQPPESEGTHLHVAARGGGDGGVLLYSGRFRYREHHPQHHFGDDQLCGGVPDLPPQPAVRARVRGERHGAHRAVGARHAGKRCLPLRRHLLYNVFDQRFIRLYQLEPHAEAAEPATRTIRIQRDGGRNRVRRPFFIVALHP